MIRHAIAPTLGLLALLACGGAQADARADALRALDARQDRAALAQLVPLAKAAPDDAELQACLGRAYARAGQAEAAVTALARAVELAPQQADYRRHLAGALGQRINQVNFLRKAGLAGQLREHLERAVQLEPGSVAAREALLQYYAQAPAIAGGSMDKAREQVAAVAKFNPAEALRLQASVTRFENKAEADVIAAWEKAVAAPGALPEARMEYGQYLQARKRWEPAFAQFEALAQAPAAAPGARYQFGKTAVLSGLRLAEGEAAFKSYLETGPKAEHDPPREAAHWRLGMLLERAGRRDDARAQYRLALQENPGHEESRKALDALD